MNNYQRYENEIKDILALSMDSCEPMCNFISQHCNTGINCDTADSAVCSVCIKRFREWLDKEYVVELTKFEIDFFKNLQSQYHYITKDKADDCITVWENYPVYDSGGGYWVSNSNNPGEYATFECFLNFFSSLQDDRVYEIDDLLNR